MTQIGPGLTLRTNVYNLLSLNIRTWVVCVTGGQSSLFLNRYSNKDIVKESNPDRSRD